MSGGLATLEILSEPGSYEALEKTSATLATELQQLADAARVPIAINRVGSMLTPFFVSERGKRVLNYADATASDTKRFATFFHAMLAQGVFLPPSQYEAWFVSLAHTEDTIDQTLAAAGAAFDAVAGMGG
jgi:glutamate-1-semialdehyde 2,1-aminomutase